MTSEPVVVLVHGAWHGAWCWAALQAELDRRGVATHAVDLPGHGASILPLGDLNDDADHVASVVEALGRDVVLVGHSYGGAVISQASENAPLVRGLVYLTAFVLDEGESVMSMLTSLPRGDVTLGTAVRPGPVDGTTVVDPSLAVAAFYATSPVEVTAAAIARLGPQTLASFTQPANGAGWKRVPSVYVRCTLDEAIHPDHQAAMGVRCTELVQLETDHSPFLSMVAETAAVIERAWVAARDTATSASASGGQR